MRMPGSRRPPTATVPRRGKPALPPWAVRAVDRWGFVAGVTGLLANALLAVLFTTPAGRPYAWAGSANDIVSVVATLAMIPVAAALLAACGNSPGLGAITSLAIVAMIAIPAALLLLVLGLMPFAVQTDISYAGLICIFGWVFVAGRAAGRRPRQVANCGLVLGAAGMAGAALLAASVPMPAHWLSQDITYGAELLAGIPGAFYPVWLIVLSYRLPGHLADRVGSARRSSPRGPGSRASSAASGHMVMRWEGHTA
jgi:hypothetical protein